MNLTSSRMRPKMVGIIVGNRNSPRPKMVFFDDIELGGDQGSVAWVVGGVGELRRWLGRPDGGSSSSSLCSFDRENERESERKSGEGGG
ncbi:hypothetical protein PanWU01x14_007810 [Parasponia andersonii]|uniref:Uncharacterized protein n=1 Tax=Parasponia andersonii TaxID=3476 RepID=A0A2P5E467_PARAD|nr:hypothetical protein PanWU01x14_007810 [Parasponia andersonii]